jgi:hypothetical protein
MNPDLGSNIHQDTQIDLFLLGRHKQSEYNALHLHPQVLQKTQGHYNIGIFKSQVISKGLCVANDKRALVAVRAPGTGNIVGIDVEPEISHIWKPAQDSRRTARIFTTLSPAFARTWF